MVLGGGDYSIADMAVFPWALIESRRLGEAFPFLDRKFPEHPNLAAWVDRCEARPAVKRALDVHADYVARRRGVARRSRPHLRARAPRLPSMRRKR